MNKAIQKLMMALAVCGAVLSAHGAVQSDVVGYKTFTLSDTYSLIGVCFQGVDGKAMTLNAAIPYSSGMTKGASVSTSDTLQVMGADGNYTLYFLSNGYYGKNNSNYNAELDGKWLKTAGAACADTISAGQSFWYMSRAAKETPHSITIAGQVLKTSSSEEVDCSETYTLVGNPYAVEVPLNDNVITTGSTKAATVAAADNLQVMGEDGNYSLYFLSNGSYGKNNSNYNASLDGKWLKTAGAECTDTIPVGGSFWYVSRNKANTVKITNPVAE